MSSLQNISSKNFAKFTENKFALLNNVPDPQAVRFAFLLKEDSSIGFLEATISRYSTKKHF